MTVVEVSAPMYQSYLFHWASRLNWYTKAWTSFWSLTTRRSYLKYLVKIRLLLILVMTPSLGDLVLPTSPG